MAQSDAGRVEVRDTCCFACEIDFTQILGQGQIEVVQSEGTLRLRIRGKVDQPLQVEISEKAGEPGTKVHRYRFK